MVVWGAPVAMSNLNHFRNIYTAVTARVQHWRSLLERKRKSRPASFGRRRGFGGGVSCLWPGSSVNARPHRTGALKQDEWIQTYRQLDEWGRELPPGRADLPRPRTRVHIINTTTVMVIFRGTAAAAAAVLGPRCPLISQQREASFCSVDMWTWWDGAMTALTVSSWVSGAVRSGLVITEHCQNTSKLQQGHGGKRATTVSEDLCVCVYEQTLGDADIFHREVTHFLLCDTSTTTERNVSM